MTVFNELIQNIFLIIIMGILYSYLYRRLNSDSPFYKILSGLLFGTIATTGMIFPMHLIPGIIFDGRSIIISISALFGGPIVALIATSMTGTVRYCLGGSGALMGILVTASSAAIGVIYHFMRRRNENLMRIPWLYLFGIIVHLAMLALMMTLPREIRFDVFEKMFLPVIIIYPAATVIICRALLDQETKITVNRELRQSEKSLRTSLEEKELLLKEIHHRVKNNMQIISSLLSLQGNSIRDDSVREIFSVTQNRILSMALVHEKLYRSDNLSMIDFESYIRSLTSELAKVYENVAGKITLIIESQNISLPIDRAIPCAMIINELVSNSYKHAFPGDLAGEIRVEFRHTEHGSYILVISDNGKASTNAVIGTDSGLGLSIVNNLVKQIHGTIRCEHENGFRCVIEF